MASRPAEEQRGVAIKERLRALATRENWISRAHRRAGVLLRGRIHRELGALESLPISTVMGKDSLAQIAPADTAIGPPSAPARRLVDASVSDNTRRAYAGALRRLDT